jgi:hypothetical protein
VNLPDWNDDDGLLALVEEEFTELQWLDSLDLRRPPQTRRADIDRANERRAIGEAKAGNFRQLVYVRRWRLQNGLAIGLSAEAEELINRKLLGERRVKKGRGVSKRSSAEREASSTFCAAQDVPFIMDVLRKHFSGRRPYKVRAQELAARQWDVQVETLINFMNKGRHFY